MPTLAQTQQAAINAMVDARGLNPALKTALFNFWHDTLYPNDKLFDFNHFKRHIAEKLAALPAGEAKTRLTILRDDYLALEGVDPNALVDLAIDGT